MVKTIVIVEWLFYGVVIFFAITQIFIPVITGRPMWPLLHRRGRELESMVANARQEDDFRAMEKTLDADPHTRTKKERR